MKFILFAALTVVCNAAIAENPDVKRGELLYENHCGGCHEAHVHMREGSVILEETEIRSEVVRWANELELRWIAKDANDVSEFLYLKYYINRLK